jgi:hypothetical protein
VILGDLGTHFCCSSRPIPSHRHKRFPRTMSSSTDVSPDTQKASLNLQASILVAQYLVGRSERLQRELRPRLDIVSQKLSQANLEASLTDDAQLEQLGEDIGYMRGYLHAQIGTPLHNTINDTLDSLDFKIPNYAEGWPPQPSDTPNQLDLMTAGYSTMAVSARTLGDNDFVETVSESLKPLSDILTSTTMDIIEKAGGVSSLVRPTDGQSLLSMAESLKNLPKPDTTQDDAWERFSTTVGHFHHHMSAFDKVPTEELVVACLLDSTGLVGSLASYYDSLG